MDRSFDFCAPFAHDWGYWHMAFDLYSDPYSQDTNKPENYDKVKECCLKADDPYWQQYKTYHVAKALGALDKNVKELIEMNRELQALKKKVQNSSNDMPDSGRGNRREKPVEKVTESELLTIVRKNAEMENNATWLNFHTNLLKKAIQAKGIDQKINVEQVIMSGLRDDLSAVLNEEAYKLVQKNL